MRARDLAAVCAELGAPQITTQAIYKLRAPRVTGDTAPQAGHR